MEQIIASLLEKGWPGLVVAVSLFAIWKMWGMLEEKQKRIDDLQEKRMAEALENIKVVEKNNTTLAGLIDIIKARGA